MLKVNGIALNFDLTSPTDVQRYKEAGERMEKEEIPTVSVSPDDPSFWDSYIAMLNGELRVFGNFIDDVFGDGIAKKLLGDNPSLTKVTEINDALHEAMEAHGKELGVKLQKYKPNRATRRSK